MADDMTYTVPSDVMVYGDFLMLGVSNLKVVKSRCYPRLSIVMVKWTLIELLAPVV
jgi:hypothetical protein